MRRLIVFCGILFSMVATANSNVSYEDYVQRKVLIPVPEGNRNRSMPDIDGSRKDSNYDAKYIKALSVLRKDKKILEHIKKVSALYGIDPVHVVGAIIGEHTFNVSVWDSIQSYATGAAGMAGNWALRFKSNGIDLTEVIVMPQFNSCNKMANDFYRWSCIHDVWDSSFRGKKVNGTWYSGSSIRSTFFNPIGVGITYGLGQMGPDRALFVADAVHKIGGLPMMDLEEPKKAYEMIIHPESMVHFLAATIAASIQVYADVAGFDISKNPGLTATLYNLGKDLRRAEKLFSQNEKLLKAGRPIQYPEENFYGWLVNEKISDLRALLQGKLTSIEAPHIDEMMRTEVL